MPKFNFHLGVTLRCYGNVEIEAESIEAALPLLTADFIGENIDISETTTDSGQDLAVIDITDADTGEDLAAYDGLPLPSPYDPPSVPVLAAAAHEMHMTLKAIIDQEETWEAESAEDVNGEEWKDGYSEAIGEAASKARTTLAKISAPREPAGDVLEQLRKAEEFIRGFEGDELQEGIDELLAGIRSALSSAQIKAEQSAKAAAFFDHIEKARAAGKDWWADAMEKMLAEQVEQDRLCAEILNALKSADERIRQISPAGYIAPERWAIDAAIAKAEGRANG
jgi:hypothetical protein